MKATLAAAGLAAGLALASPAYATTVTVNLGAVPTGVFSSFGIGETLVTTNLANCTIANTGVCDTNAASGDSIAYTFTLTGAAVVSFTSGTETGGNSNLDFGTSPALLPGPTLSTTSGLGTSTMIFSSYTNPAIGISSFFAHFDLTAPTATTYTLNIQRYLQSGTAMGWGGTINFNIQPCTDTPACRAVSEVPIPAGLPLFGTALLAAGIFGWRRKDRALVNSKKRAGNLA